MFDRSLSEANLRAKRVVVFVAHPGHELRIYRLLEIAKPVVHVLTDGSGSQAASRIHSTTHLLEKTGSRAGSVYGRFADKDIYAMMLSHDYDGFRVLVDEYVESLRAADAEVVVADMMEGYNSSHDICRILVEAAVNICRRRYGMQIANYDFPLMGLPGRYAAEADVVTLNLDDAAFDRKLEAADQYPELRHEVDAAISQLGRAPFQLEVLRPVSSEHGHEWTEAERPYYETYGEKQVEAGIYKYVIRYSEHIKPIADALMPQPASV